MTNSFKRTFAMLAMLVLTLGLFTNALPAQAATVWKDVSNTHWARGPIYSWTNQGLVGGFKDGTFRPNQPITRAEFLAFVNRAFGFKAMAEINIADVQANAWYAGDIRKAVAQGYAGANEQGVFEPNRPITRLESMTMLYKVMRLTATEQDFISVFKDATTLTEEGRLIMNTAVAEGYIGGYTDQTVRPYSTLTRAEMVALLSRVVGTRYATAGVHGPETGVVIINGNVTIPATGVILCNALVKGDLYITEGVGDGEVTLQSVKVEGRTIMAGGGDHSIYSTGTTELPHVIVADPDGNVHVVFLGDATSGLISWQSGGSYSSDSETNRPSIQLSAAIPAGSTVQLVGNFDAVELEASGINVEMGETSQATTVQVQPTATGNTLTFAGTVETLTVAAETTMTVTGSVSQLTVEPTATNAALTITGEVTTLDLAATATLDVAGQVTTLNVDSAATVTVAAEATIETVATTENSSGAVLDLNGTVTSLQLSSENTVTVGATGTVTSIVAAETADGSAITVEGQVTELKSDAPIAVAVEEGATLTTVVLESGASGTSVTTGEGVTAPTVTAPPDVTWDNNGETQTGSTLPPISGGGGGAAAPIIIAANVLDENGISVPGAGYNMGTRTVDLTTLADTVQISGVAIYALPINTELTITSVSVWGQAVDGFSNVKYTCPAVIDIQTLMGQYGSLIELLLNTSGEDFDGDVSMGMLRALLGDAITINGTVGLGGDLVITYPAVVTVILGPAQGQTSVPTPWVDASVSGTTISATIVQPSTQLAGNLNTLISAVSLVGLDNVLPTSIAVTTWCDPNSDTNLATFKAELSAEVGVDWANMTLGDLVGHSIYFKAPDGTTYTVTFQ